MILVYQVAETEVLVEEKRVRNFNLRLSPDGKIKASVPRGTKERNVLQFLEKHQEWIRRQAKRAASPGFKKLQFRSGELIPLRGEEYLLQVVDHSGRAKVSLQGGVLQLLVPHGASRKKKEEVVLRWWRRALRDDLDWMIPLWAGRIGVEPKKWRIQEMSSLWGSCRPDAGSITINLQLIKKDPRFLEYIVVHELVHFLEGGHGERFQRLMDHFLPGWRSAHQELNGSSF